MTGNKNREFMSVSQFLSYMNTQSLNCEDELFCVLRTFLSETCAGCLDKENHIWSLCRRIISSDSQLVGEV